MLLGMDKHRLFLAALCLVALTGCDATVETSPEPDLEPACELPSYTPPSFEETQEHWHDETCAPRDQVEEVCGDSYYSMQPQPGGEWWAPFCMHPVDCACVVELSDCVDVDLAKYGRCFQPGVES